MNPRLRKFALTAHVAFSVGWIGAAAAFFALSIAGMTSQSAEVVRSAYLSMNLISLYIIVPLSLAALATGLIQSLGTPWGLFRHYWVVIKFFLTVLSVVVLVLHQYTAVAAAARIVSGADGVLPSTKLSSIEFVLVRASGLGMLVLLVATTLSVYKPWGLTQYGRRKQEARQYQLSTLGMARISGTENTLSPLNEPARDSFPRGLKMFLVASVGVLLVILIVSMHITGHTLHHAH